MKRIIYILCALLALQTTVVTDAYARKGKKGKKTLVYVIGDSTVKNGKGKGDRGQWGWGSFVGEYFDETKADVRNHAIGGRSSRTFITEGRWDAVLDSLGKDDYVLIQFGHNDGGDIFTGNRPRASLKGVGNQDTTGIVEMSGKTETVVTYGAYLRRYIREAREKGAQPILCTLIPRNRWKDGKIMRDDKHAVWARQVAREEGVPCIDLNTLIADIYDEMGQEAVKTCFTEADWTHTSEKGARINARVVSEQIQQIPKCKLRKLLK
ncbi:MAG: rhamnogalacturonan acetylesterase [Coprobacter sp.]|nr:rhamnogalacturonan acetylesterase [Coprobacter sp.]